MNTNSNNDNELIKLADACNDGACNLSGLTRSLVKAIDLCSDREHPAIPVVLGHLHFLSGDGIGPSSQALKAYEKFKLEREATKAEEPAKRTFTVVICRTGISIHEVTVTANDEAEAREIAMRDAGNHTYREGGAEYEVDDSWEEVSE